MKFLALIMICLIPLALAACSEMPAGFGDDHASPLLIASGQFAQGSGGSSDAAPASFPANDKRPGTQTAPSARTDTSIAAAPPAPFEPTPTRSTTPRTMPPTTPPALPTPW